MLLDGAHNPQGARALARYAAGLEKKRTALLCGILRDKDCEGMVKILAPICDEVVVVSPDSTRAMPAQALAELFGKQGRAAQCAPDAATGIRMAREAAGEGGRVIAAGSLYLAGEVRTLVVGEDYALLKE